ncbi:MAG: NAD-dependent protein deacylase [Hirschia sp.]|mgnify:CR=1 FL=1|nr:NAD-dependent protein deacylase [Hirschia sp.]MBF18526.1 NAD-dependent protein deacylase [Hirschia sp.]MBF18931.1 NAD-dependent protein deacylase [Hirschia sp.]MBF20292.1 NAD-dependent protein deacylase [Hirschia sp.]
MQIVILTGAGISAESGLGTFRDKDGIWTRVNLEDVATPEGFARNPDMVHEFYNKRRSDLTTAKANPAHFALARLEQQIGQLAKRPADDSRFTLVTQNIDNLHQQAGSRSVIHMHGELLKGLCTNCDWRGEWSVDMQTDMPCPQCAHDGRIRPDVVWFGEMPYHMDEIFERLHSCDLFVSIGTSGSVYPAAMFVGEAKRAGAMTLELNLEPSENADEFNEGLYGPASEIVPAWVDKMIAASS